jgi:hypothetical protein
MLLFAKRTRLFPVNVRRISLRRFSLSFSRSSGLVKEEAF